MKALSGAVSQIVTDELQQTCQCLRGDGQDTIITNVAMMCHPQFPGHIVYRAQLQGTRAVSVETLLEHTQNWAREGPLISAEGELLNVEPFCSVRIPSLEAAPCSDITFLRGQAPLSLKPEVTSAVVISIVFLIVIVLAVSTIIVLRRTAAFAKTSAV